MPFSEISWKSAIFGPVWAFFASFLLGACNSEPKPRTYSEVPFKENARPGSGQGVPGMGALPPTNASPVDIKVTWTLPESWMIRDSANAMRVIPSS
jgi:hypothetical protein